MEGAIPSSTGLSQRPVVEGAGATGGSGGFLSILRLTWRLKYDVHNKLYFF